MNHFQYPWGQPSVYNKDAFEELIPWLEKGGLMKQCLEYRHNVGNAIFHQMHSIPTASVRARNSKTVDNVR